MAAWIYPLSFTGGLSICSINVLGSNNNRFAIITSSAGRIDVMSRVSSNVSAVTSTNAPLNQWSHVAGVIASTTSRAAYLNGGSKGTNTTSVAPAGMNRVRVGLSSTDGAPFDGRIAEFAIWNVDLTDAEVAALATGINPMGVRRGSLVGYWPLWGVDSPEPDYTGSGRSLVNTGSVAYENHAPIVLRQKRIAFTSGAVAVVVSAVGLATGVGTATAVGASRRAGAGTSTGVGTGPAVGRSIASAAAAGAGNGTASAGGAVISAVTPNSLESSINLQDSALTAPPALLTDIDDDPTSPDPQWWTAIDSSLGIEARVGMPAPPGALSGAQRVRVRLRRAHPGTTPVGQSGAWTLVFQDEFAGAAVDTAKWEPSWFGGVGLSQPVNTAEEACYNPAQLSVSGGTLKIALATNSNPACQTKASTQAPYQAGLINTRNSFLYTYGYIEARINLPGSGGLAHNWAAFWSTGDNWPVTGEIDVLETLGTHKPGWNYHYDDGGAQAQGGTVDMDGTGWHVYAAKWEPGAITYYYDGAQVGQVTGPEVVEDVDHYLVLDYTVSTAIAGTPVVPATMEVDYVRVWALP